MAKGYKGSEQLDRLKLLRRETLRRVYNSKEALVELLALQARLYKYSFENALLIYAQRPDAVSCGDYKEWDDIGRHPQKGSRSLQVYFDSSRTSYKNIFELGDTYGTPYKYLYQESIPEHYQRAVLAYLGSAERIQFYTAVEGNIKRNYESYISRYVTTNPDAQFGELYSEAFKQSIPQMASYIVCQRFNQPHGSQGGKHFLPYMQEINTPSKLSMVGSISRDIAYQIIRGIQRTQTNEWRKENEQQNIGRESAGSSEDVRVRELSGHRRIGTGSVDRDGGVPSAVEQRGALRQDVEEIHAGEPHGESPSDGIRIGDRGTSLQDSGGGGYRSEGNDDEPTGAVPAEESTPDRGLHGDTTVRGTVESLVGGDNSERDSVQIEINTPSMEPLVDEAEGSNTLPEEKSLSEPPTRQEIIDDILVHGKLVNTDRASIQNAMLTLESPTERANYLREAYRRTSESQNLEGGGKLSWYTDNSRLFIRYNTAMFYYEETLSWKEVEAEVSRLVNADMYMPEQTAAITPETDTAKENYLQSVLLKIQPTHGSFERIYNYFQDTSLTGSALAGILKKEFGIGGQSFDFSKSSGFVLYDRDGITIKQNGITNDTVAEKHSWIQVAVAIRQLIHDGVYPSPQGEPVSNEPDPSDEITTEHIADVEPTFKAEPQWQEDEQDNPAQNYHINSAEDIGIASGKTKYRLNIEAIRTMKEIEALGRSATPEEQAVLAKYSGWGGIPQAFDDGNENWSNEYSELKELLTSEEYTAARGSTLNAHYTSIEVVNAMFNGLSRLGFTGGNILEPAMGVGHFFGALPDELQSSRLYGVELDSITGRIAKALYPQANIEIGGFEDSSYLDNFFDGAIGNVPFGSYMVHDPKFNRYNFLIHDYFIAKSLDKVKPGGVIAYITAKGTMDKANTAARRYIAERAELLGAIRLPNDAFKESAGTAVTTDILFLKKRELMIDATNESWVYTGQIPTGKLNDDGKPELLPLNQYYIDHPEMMLGKMAYYSNMYGNNKETALLPHSAFVNRSREELLTERFNIIRAQENLTAKPTEWDYPSLWFNRIEKTIMDNGGVADKMAFNTYEYKNYGGIDSLSERFYGGRLDNFFEMINSEEPDLSSVSLNELLEQAISRLPENVLTPTNEQHQDVAADEAIPALPNVKNFCYTVVEGKVYQREDSLMWPVDLPQATLERLTEYIGIRDITRELLQLQLNGCSEETLRSGQQRLNSLYDNFTAKYSDVNSRYNISKLGDDADFPLVSALESIDEGGSVSKADIFYKRTLVPYKKIEHTNSAVEALAVSLNERGLVDLPYMAKLTNKDEDKIVDELKGVIFLNVGAAENQNQTYVTADEYLSGNVRQKLESVRAANEVLGNDSLADNIKALEAVQPEPVQAHEIGVRFGASWIEPELYRQFIIEQLELRPWEYSKLQVSYAAVNNNWHISKPPGWQASVAATQSWGTKRMDAYSIMEAMLNQKPVKVTKIVECGDGNERRVVDREATIAAKNKQNAINEAFKEWLFRDPQRRETLVEKYNILFNSERVRQYDGSFLRFEGMNAGITLNELQRNAVARVLLGGNTLLAHVVGAGKTYTMAAAAIEMKRMGLAQKPCFVVPNHLVSQWANEFKRLYPAANILATTKRDFETKRRKRFCARIATGEWDAVIIGHSQFELIPMSAERQALKIEKELRSAKDGLSELKNSRGERFMVKQMESTIKSLEAKLKNLNSSRNDNVINFEELGIDALFVDEAHMYKNKFMFTKMSNVSGISSSMVQKSYDMEMKCDYINELNGGERGVIFATGTPVSNSMSEMYTMQSYLQKQTLNERGLDFFDNWASNFGEVVSSLELNPSGQGFRLKDRFAKFVNLPELMNMYRKVADIQTSDMLNLNVPTVLSGKPITIAAEASESQKRFVEALVELSEMSAKGAFERNEYNMLCVTSDGRLGAIDLRCVNIDKMESLLGRDLGIDTSDFAGGKVNLCVNKVFDIYQSTEDKRLTQMIFCDVSTPKGGKEFSVYDDVKQKLIEKGVKPEEITFIHDAKSNEEKERLFAKMRSGELRILMGSTQRMGSGTNAQKKLIALHHLDCPWRPSDLAQREGRIVRQGNDNPEVQIYNYVTKNTFDSYLWQTVETKQKFISQVMTGKAPSRTMEDIDEAALNFAEVKAIATGNPAIRRKMELEMEASRLRVLKQQYMAGHYELESKVINTYPRQIAATQVRLEDLQQDINRRNSFGGDFAMTISGKHYTERADAGKELLKLVQDGKHTDKSIGNYKGFDIIPNDYNMLTDVQSVELRGARDYTVEISRSAVGSVQRIKNAAQSFEVRVSDAEEVLENTLRQLEAAKVQLEKPFEHENALMNTLHELDEVNASLDIGKDEDLDANNQASDASAVISQEVEVYEDEGDWDLEM